MINCLLLGSQRQSYKNAASEEALNCYEVGEAALAIRSAPPVHRVGRSCTRQPWRAEYKHHRVQWAVATDISNIRITRLS